MALSIEASQVFPQASRNLDASVIFQQIDLMQLPEFMRSTTLRWTFLVAGIFAAFIVALLGFIYLKTESDLTTRSDRVIASQTGVFAGLSPERRLEAINEHLQRCFRTLWPPKATGVRDMRFILMAVSLALLASSPASASCLEQFPSDMKERPDFTCVPLTDRLFVSLEGATMAEVAKAMKAIGRPLGPIVHFVSFADNYPGGVNLTIEGDRVVLISATVDSPEDGKTMWFIWNPAYHGPTSMPCSDLPDSHYARCGK
jgi:hypothetical protein